MPQNNVKLDELIKLFVSTEEYHIGKMDTPVRDNSGNVVATNAKMIIQAPGSLFDNYGAAYPFFRDSPNFPEYYKMIPPHIRDKVLLKIDAQMLYDTCKGMPRENIYEDCEYCEGFGRMYTQNQEEKHCQECGGDGHAELIDNLIRIPNIDEDIRKKPHRDKQSFVIRINKTYLNPNLAYSVAKLAVGMGKNIDVIRIENSRPAIFYVGDVMILVSIMGMTTEDTVSYQGKLNIVDIKPNTSL